MDATLDQEQEMLADTARRMAEDLGPGSVPDLERYDPDRATRELTASGMTALAVPERLGGSGAGCFEAALVAEALARRLVPVPYIGPVLALELLRAAGDDQAVAQILAGDRRVTLGLERDLTAVAAGADAVAWEAGGMTHAVVSVVSGEAWRPGLVALEGGDDVPSSDLTRRLVRIPSHAPESGAAHDLSAPDLARWEAFALSMLCADTVGAMEGALAMAVDHAKSRIQFGQPIGSFQAVQHLCAEQLVDVEASRAATHYSAWAVSGLPPEDARQAARTAKAYVSRAGRSVTEAVLQVHGGIGQTWESLAHAYLRRVLLDRATLGDETVHVARLGHDLVAAGRPPSAA